MWLRLKLEFSLRGWGKSVRLQHLLPLCSRVVCTVLESVVTGGRVHSSVPYGLSPWDTAAKSVNGTNACVVVAETTPTFWCRCVCDREKLCYTRNGDAASVHCRKWDSFNNLLHTWFSLCFCSSGSTQNLLLVCCTLHRSLKNHLQGRGMMLNFWGLFLLIQGKIHFTACAASQVSN